MPEDLIVYLNLDPTEFVRGIESAKRGTDSFAQEFAKAMGNSARSIEDVNRMMTRIDLANIAVQQSTDAVSKAQENYNAALARYGPHSEQARKAAEALDHAHQSLDRAQMRADLSMGLVAVQAVQMGAKIPALVGQLGALSTAEWSAATAAAGFESAVSLGAAAVGIVAGIAAIKAAMEGFDTTTNATTSDFGKWKAQLDASLKTMDTFRKQSDSVTLDFWNIKTVQDYYKAVRAATEAQIGMRKVGYDQAVAYSAELDRERILTSGTVEEAMKLRESLEQTKHVLQGQLLSGSILDPTQFDATKGALANLDSELGQVDKHLSALGADATSAAQKVAQEWQKTNSALQTMLGAGLGAVSAQLKDLSVQAQRPILINAGMDPAFVDTLMATQQAEDALTVGALRSSKALRDQTTITAKKDETTEHFRQRLVDLGFTETEIAARIDATGRSLKAQTAATAAAASVTANVTKKASSGGWVTSPGGASAPSLEEFISAHESDIKSAFFGSGQISFRLDAQQVASHLMNGESGIGIPNVGAWVGSGPGSSQYEKMIGTLKGLITHDLPSNQWDSLLGQIGVNGFAHGIEGIVTRPGLFLAGEHGPESIEVRPIALGDKQHGQSNGPTLVFQPGSIVVRGQEAGDLMRRLRRLGVNGAS